MARKCGIDHTPILVRDLESGRKAYERLGFKLTPISFHKGRASANHLIVLQRDYTEIAGPAPGAESEPMLDPFFDARGGGGISLIALMTDDAAAEAGDGFVSTFRDRELPVEGVPEIVLAKGTHSLPYIIHQSGLAPSRSEARRLVNSGAVEINGRQVSVHAWPLGPGDSIRVGKHRFLRIVDADKH